MPQLSEKLPEPGFSGMPFCLADTGTAPEKQKTASQRPERFFAPQNPADHISQKRNISGNQNMDPVSHNQKQKTGDQASTNRNI